MALKADMNVLAHVGCKLRCCNAVQTCINPAGGQHYFICLCRLADGVLERQLDVCLLLAKPSSKTAFSIAEGLRAFICSRTLEMRPMAGPSLRTYACVLQCLRVSSGDRVAAVKWLLPPDGAEVAMFTAEVDFVSRKGPAGRGPAMEVDSSLLNQHLLSRFSSQVTPAIPESCCSDLKHLPACLLGSQPDPVGF